MSLAIERHAFDRRPAGGRVVFLIHPDRELRERLSAALAAAGFHVLAASGAAEMERRLDFRFAVPEPVIGPFDPAPEAGGGIVGQLRRGSLTRDLPVVALTGGSEEERHAAHGLGLRHLVESPCEPAVLLRTARQALGESAVPAG